jgi:hypothetical protein
MTMETTQYELAFGAQRAPDVATDAPWATEHGVRAHTATAEQAARLRESFAGTPAPIQEWVAAKADGAAPAATLEGLLPGQQWAGMRAQLQRDGLAMYVDPTSGLESVLIADVTSDGRILGLAAAMPRNTGKSIDFIKEIADFQDTITSTQTSRKDAVQLFHKVYRAEGIVNNAINKMAALVASTGSFKVRSVKGQQGRSSGKNTEILQQLLDWWVDNVNARSDSGVITGDRGVTSFLNRGARLSMIEGDHFARHFWPKKKVDVPNVGAFSLPMNLQTFSASTIETPDLPGTNYEILYWVPPQSLVNLLRTPPDQNVKKLLDQIFPSDVKSALLKDGKVFLDPSLMLHVQHRGTGISTFGESAIEPVLSDIRYKRALDALEITTITNLINRMVIVKVGSDNKDSAYHTAEVSESRLLRLQRAMQKVGTSATILWPGPDIDVIEVSAHEGVLDLNDRFRIAERRILMALGVPAVLMIGEGGDGKAVGYAAALAVAAQLKDIQNQYANALRGIAEAIAEENGFDGVDVVWEYHENLLDDKAAAAELILKVFQLGLADTQTAVEELGFEYDQIKDRQDKDVAAGYKEQPFGPPPAALTTNATGTGGATGGRPTKAENPSPDPRANKEAPTQPNKAPKTPAKTPTKKKASAPAS